MSKRSLFGTLSLSFLILLLTACGVGNQQKGRQPSADWSRGLPVGSDLRGAVGLHVEPSGERVHLLWPEAVEDEVTLHYEQLDSSVTTVVETNLTLPGGQMRSPLLLPQADGELTLFWAARASGDEGWRVWGTTLDQNGQNIGTPQPFSSEEMNVGDYAVGGAGASVQYVVWEDARTDTLHGQQLDAGEPLGTAVELAAGQAPALAVDEEGTLHLLWQQEEGLYYTRYRPGTLSFSSGTRVADLRIAFGDTLDGPVMVLNDGWIYGLWSIFSQSGLESGTGRTEYIAFPLSEPRQEVPTRLGVMPVEDQPYEPYSGDFQLTQLVPPPTSRALSSDYVGEPALTTGPGSAVAAVVSTNQAWRQQTVVQLAAFIFDQGEPLGYQMAAKTQNVSQDAAVASDAAGNLYLVWNEGAGGLDAYFATTAPAMREAINALDAGDAANLILTSGMESVVGLLFMPLVVIWMLPGALLSVFWRMRHQDEDAARPASRIVFVVGIALYQILKVMFMPAIQSYVPFSAWLDIAPALREPLILLVPVAIFLIALAVAELFRLRREETSTPLYFLIVAAVDGALTLVVYGVNFLGVF